MHQLLSEDRFRDVEKIRSFGHGYQVTVGLVPERPILVSVCNNLKEIEFFQEYFLLTHQIIKNDILLHHTQGTKANQHSCASFQKLSFFIAKLMHSFSYIILDMEKCCNIEITVIGQTLIHITNFHVYFQYTKYSLLFYQLFIHFLFNLQDNQDSLNHHLTQIIEFVYAMHDVVRAYNSPMGTDFQLRSGVTMGPISVGVIGARRPLFDMWGFTMYLANLMEASGKPNCIQVRVHFIIKCGQFQK